MNRSYYSDTISNFLSRPTTEILGILSQSNEFSLEQDQRNAWQEQITLLKSALLTFTGKIYFEFSIPRLGKRIDVLLLIRGVIYILEFKVGERDFPNYALDQVWDYALDLKNFHEPSHHATIAPILIATAAPSSPFTIATTHQNDGVLSPIKSNGTTLPAALNAILEFANAPDIDALAWEQGRYRPTPTIIEAAVALYGGHNVADIANRSAEQADLTKTSDAVSNIIQQAKSQSQKSICFVTGVPGAGKTLVGLNIATKYSNAADALHSVFLSGNGPLVNILREALARDSVLREKRRGKKITKEEARRKVKAFIQPVHHFRDDCLKDSARPPIEHVALFDEAQRAWNLHQTASFMLRKKSRPNFNQSEPEFLISCLNRHPDWAVVVCLVGGGQEINTGEAGIGEWIQSLLRSFPDWHIYISPRLTDTEFGAGKILKQIESRPHVTQLNELHLGVSMRSFRAENVSALVKQLLDLDHTQARKTLHELQDRYPIAITRDLSKAKSWVKLNARANERYGIVVSSEAQRLKPHAIDVKSPIDPIHWFLDDKSDVRSSYYMEDVATEFHVQGLELDWACITWDADLRYSPDGWQHFSFCGDRWNNIHKPDRKMYLKNAYRVLLTRARQGMIIVVPNGDPTDPTRHRDYYDSTFEYLSEIGFQTV